MNVLVTGCAGFIGSHLCEKLLFNKESKILGIDNINDYYDRNQKFENLELLKKFSNFTFYEDDICTTKVINIFKPEIVVNIAAMAGVRYSVNNPTICMRVNVEGQINLLKQCVDNDVKLFVYASSSSVYGKNTKVPFQEDDKLNKINSPYAASKMCSEILAGTYHRLYGLKTIGLRFFTVYGPRGRPDMAPYKFLNAIYQNKKFDKYGNGETYRDYTYVDDIVNGIIGAIKNKKNKDCEVYNLGNSKPITLNEFIKTCEKVTGKKAIFNQLPDQKGDVPKTYADITKAKNDLDYNPKVSFEGGLRKTYEWLSNKS